MFLYDFIILKEALMFKHTIKILFLILSFYPLLLVSDVDLQTNVYDAADEMVAFDEKMNRLIAEHNGITEAEDQEMRQNDKAIEDFLEIDNKYVLRCEVEDHNNTQIELSLKDKLLTIKRTKTVKNKIMLNNTVNYETTTTTAINSLYIPNDADEKSMKNNYKNGMLIISFLKNR
jgi:HSP20 family molecular chaperone IbpA